MATKKKAAPRRGSAMPRKYRTKKKVKADTLDLEAAKRIADRLEGLERHPLHGTREIARGPQAGRDG